MSREAAFLVELDDSVVDMSKLQHYSLEVEDLLLGAVIVGGSHQSQQFLKELLLVVAVNSRKQ